MHCGLDALRSHAKVPDPAALAERTEVRHWLLVVAVVTGQPFALQMICQGDVTARTALHVTTVAAHHERRCATAVQKQDHLLSIGQGAFHLLLQHPG